MLLTNSLTVVGKKLLLILDVMPKMSAFLRHRLINVGKVSTVIDWAVFTTFCNLLCSWVFELPNQAVVQPVIMLFIVHLNGYHAA